MQYLNEEEINVCNELIENGQSKILDKLQSEVQWRNFFTDVYKINKTYDGGIINYIKKAKQLLKDLAEDVNPIEGYNVEIPSGIDLEFGSPSFNYMEAIGREHLKQCAFVVTGGGVGERLKSSYIKLSLVPDLVRDYSYLEDYCSYFHAIETEYDCHVPLAILTSNDTHNATRLLLEEHNYFGLDASNVVLLEQEGVPAISTIDGDLAVDEDGHIIMKPHGNGDIHRLMNQYHVADRWKLKDIKYILFLQDTNGLATHSFAPLLGVAESHSYHFTSVAVQRRPGEKIGCICRLVGNDETNLICNVEYMQLKSVLTASTGRGDVANETGYSDFPGNINVLCVNLNNYCDVLRQTGGILPEFVNPKFRDFPHLSFISSTRLECTMEDYPKLLPPVAGSVGFVILPRFLCFSAVKNDDTNARKQFAATGYAESFSSGEEDIYRFYRRVIRSYGVNIGNATADITPTPPCGLPTTPIVVMSHRSGLTIADMGIHFGEGVQISDGSIVIIDGEGVKLERMEVRGTLIIRACKGATVLVHDCIIENRGWIVERVDKSDARIVDKFALRGYTFKKIETREMVFDRPGNYDILC